MIASLVLASFFAAAVPDQVAIDAAAKAGFPNARVVTAEEARRVSGQAVRDTIMRCREVPYGTNCVVSVGDGREWNSTSLTLSDDPQHPMSRTADAWWLPEARTLQPLRVGGDVKAPMKLSDVPPQYPEVARRARISGIVITEVTIDKSGRVVEAHVLKPLPMGLDQAALDAVKQWTFTPVTLNGAPVDALYNLTVNFRIDSPPDGNKQK